MRNLILALLVLGALVAPAVGVLLLAVHGGTCSPHEGGSGCRITLELAIPWVVSVGLIGCVIALIVRRP